MTTTKTEKPPTKSRSYVVIAIIFFPMPLLPLLQDPEPMIQASRPSPVAYIFPYLLVFIGCACAVKWFLNTKGIFSKIGTGILAFWHLGITAAVTFFVILDYI